jgi:hypothetical protein
MFVFNFMQCFYNYVPETNRVSWVFIIATLLYLQFLLHVMLFNVATVLYLQFLLHVMLFRQWNMFCAFIFALSAVCLQCPIWLLSVISRFRALRYVAEVLLEWFWDSSSLSSYNRYHFAFIIHMRWISIVRSWYTNIDTYSYKCLLYNFPPISLHILKWSSAQIVSCLCMHCCFANIGHADMTRSTVSSNCLHSSFALCFCL